MTPLEFERLMESLDRIASALEKQVALSLAASQMLSGMLPQLDNDEE